jgi:hypothetical protein
MEQMKKENDVYTLKLGETKETPDGWFYVTRVPGGWIYTDEVSSAAAAFVPWSDIDFHPEEYTDSFDSKEEAEKVMESARRGLEAKKGGYTAPEEIMTFDGTEKSARAIARWIMKERWCKMQFEGDMIVSLTLNYGTKAEKLLPAGSSIIKKADGSTRVVKLESL